MASSKPKLDLSSDHAHPVPSNLHPHNPIVNVANLGWTFRQNAPTPSFQPAPALEPRTKCVCGGGIPRNPVTRLVTPSQPSFASEDNRLPVLTTRLETVGRFIGCADSLKHRFIAPPEKQECDGGVLFFFAWLAGGSYTQLA